MTNFDNKVNINNIHKPYTPSAKKEDVKPQPKTDETAPDVVNDGTQAADSYGRIVVTELPDPMPEGQTVEDYVVEPYATQADYFEDNLKTGNWFIQKMSKEGEWQDQSLEGSSFIYRGVDQSDFNAANAEYERKMESLESIDKKFDLQIQQLATEQSALETEMDSVKKVIDKNIEETFKTFG